MTPTREEKMAEALIELLAARVGQTGWWNDIDEDIQQDILQDMAEELAQWA